MMADLSQIVSLDETCPSSPIDTSEDPAVDYARRYICHDPQIKRKRYWGRVILSQVRDRLDVVKTDLSEQLRFCPQSSPEYQELQETAKQNSEIIRLLAHGLLPLLTTAEYPHPNRRLLEKLYLNAIKLIRQYKQYPNQGTV